MKYFLLPFLMLLIFSCSKRDNYKIIETGDFFVNVELPEKTTPENLLLYADEIISEKSPYLLSNVPRYILFRVPSAYPVNPDGEFWASVIYQMDGSRFLEINGTRSDEHKKNLLALKFKADQVIGKWYYPLPVNERVIFIAREDSQTVISEFRAESMSETIYPSNHTGSTIISGLPLNDFQHWKPYEEMEINPQNPSELKIKDEPHWQYRIDKDKNLLFLDEEGKVYLKALPVK